MREICLICWYHSWRHHTLRRLRDVVRSKRPEK